MPSERELTEERWGGKLEAEFATMMHKMFGENWRRVWPSSNNTLRRVYLAGRTSILKELTLPSNVQEAYAAAYIKEAQTIDPTIEHIDFGTAHEKGLAAALTYAKKRREEERCPWLRHESGTVDDPIVWWSPDCESEKEYDHVPDGGYCEWCGKQILIEEIQL